MFVAAPMKTKVPRKHYQGPIGPKGGTVLSGIEQATIARLLAPSASETGETLVELRRDFELSRGELAAFLAASEPALKAWERGTRSPSLIARRLVFLMDAFMRNNAYMTFADLILWKRTGKEPLADLDYQI